MNAAKQKRAEMNLCEGSIPKKMILFALPLMATNVLQLLFNAADIAVLGQFVGDDAVAAVGATGSLVSMIVSLFIGFSLGANVLVARLVGQHNRERAADAVGTCVCISLIFGVVLAGIGFFCARRFLIWMDCDPDVLDMAATYMRVYFLGMPIIMLYNFCASIMRAVGDTMRPLLFLVIGGVVNVGLNIFFVTVVKLDVEGVAIATVVSQAISVVLALITLTRADGYSKLHWKKIRIHPEEFGWIIRIGLPAGIQSSLFSFSNVIIQSTINSFGKVVMAGNAASGQIEGFAYQAMNSVALANMSFVSQNLGAGNLNRVRKSFLSAIVITLFAGILVSGSVILLRKPLCGILISDPVALDAAYLRLLIIEGTHVLCGFMDALSYGLRGLGKSTTAMVVCLCGSCLLRIVWINTIFRLNPTPPMLYVVYPISWAVTALTFVPIVHIVLKRIAQHLGDPNAEKTVPQAT